MFTFILLSIFVVVCRLELLVNVPLNGSLVNFGSKSFLPGKNEGASFVGVEYVQFSEGSFLQIGENTHEFYSAVEVSVFAEVKFDEKCVDSDQILILLNNDAWPSFQLSYSKRKMSYLEVEVLPGHSKPAIFGKKQLEPGRWYNVGFTYGERYGIRMYVNSEITVEKGNVDAHIMYRETRQTLYLGCTPQKNHCLEGGLRNVYFFSHELNEEEIEELFGLEVSYTSYPSPFTLDPAYILAIVGGSVLGLVCVVACVGCMLYSVICMNKRHRGAKIHPGANENLEAIMQETFLPDPVARNFRTLYKNVKRGHFESISLSNPTGFQRANVDLSIRGGKVLWDNVQSPGELTGWDFFVHLARVGVLNVVFANLDNGEELSMRLQRTMAGIHPPLFRKVVMLEQQLRSVGRKRLGSTVLHNCGLFKKYKFTYNLHKEDFDIINFLIQEIVGSAYSNGTAVGEPSRSGPGLGPGGFSGNGNGGILQNEGDLAILEDYMKRNGYDSQLDFYIFEDYFSVKYSDLRYILSQVEMMEFEPILRDQCNPKKKKKKQNQTQIMEKDNSYVDGVVVFSDLYEKGKLDVVISDSASRKKLHEFLLEEKEYEWNLRYILTVERTNEMIAKKMKKKSSKGSSLGSSLGSKSR